MNDGDGTLPDNAPFLMSVPSVGGVWLVEAGALGQGGVFYL